MKKTFLLTLLLLCMMTFAVFGIEETVPTDIGEDTEASLMALLGSGSCGRYASYHFDESGHLTIYGSVMNDYDASATPWFDNNHLVQDVTLSCKYVGNQTLKGLKKFRNLLITTNVTEIGENILPDVESIEQIYYEGTVEQWKNITIGANNPVLIEKNIIFGSTASTMCGPHLSWQFDSSNGRLTISGWGDMFDYEYDDVSYFCTMPWYNYRLQIKEVVLPYGITGIGKGAFYYCTGLKSVNIPQTVTKIGVRAFFRCTALTGKVYISPNVTFIGNEAFKYCTSLERYQVDSRNRHYSNDENGLLYNKKKTILYSCLGGTKLTEIIVSPNVKDLQASPFGTCRNIERVVLHYNITEIKGYTFYSCPKLKEIYISSNLKSVANYAFAESDSITDIYYSGTESEYKKITIGVGNSAFSKATVHYNSELPKYTTSDGITDIVPRIESVTLRYKGRYYNALTQSVAIMKGSNAEIDILTKMDAQGLENVKLYLTQGAATTVELTNEVYTSTYPAQTFEPGASLYVLAVDEETGNSASVELKLTIMENKGPEWLPESGIMGNNFKLGKDIGFTIPDKVPVFGGMNFAWEFDFIPITFEVEDTKLKIVIGTSLANSDGKKDTFFKDFNFEEYKKDIKDASEGLNRKPLSQIKEEYFKPQKQDGQKEDVKIPKTKLNLFDGGIKSGSLGAGSVDIDITGYAEWDILNERFLEGDILFEVEWKYTVNGQIFIWVIPMYYKIGFGVGVSIDGKMTNLSPNTFAPVFDGYLEAKIMGEVGAGIGVSKIATLGAEGEASLNIKSSINGNTYIRSWAEGEAAFRVKVFGKTVAERILAKGELLIYETGNTDGLIKSEAIEIGSETEENSGAAALLYETDIDAVYPNEADDYRLRESIWHGSASDGTAELSDVDYSGHTVSLLAENIYPEAQPLLCEINGQRVLVSQWDAEDRAAADRSMLVYSVYDADTDSWSKPTAVCDDGTADFYPCFRDGYLVWQNCKTVMSDSISLRDIAGLGEILLAKWNGSGFDAPILLTDDDILDTLPTVCADANTVTVAWLTNSDNNILGNTGSNSILSKTFADGVWSKTQMVKEDCGVVLGLTSAVCDGKMRVAYLTDTDNDMDTMTDRRVHILSDDGVVEPEHEESAVVGMPVFAQDRIYYYENGNIVSMKPDATDKETVFESAVNGLTDSFLVDENEAGDRALWWAKTDAGVTEIYTALYQNGTWSGEIRVTSLEKNSHYPTGLLLEDGTMLVAFNASTLLREETQQSDLYTVSLVPSYDLSVSAVRVNAETLSAAVTVKNSGELTVDSYTLTLIDGDEVNQTLTVTEPLAAGESRTDEIVYNRPEDFDKRTVCVKVSTDVSEYDMTNNESAFVLGLADVAIEYVVSNELLPTANVVVTVSNLGYSEAESITVCLRAEQENGEIVESQTLENLCAGESEDIILMYNPTEHENTLWFVTATLEDDEEISLGNNAECFINVSAVFENEVEHETLSVQKQNGKLYVNTHVKNHTENPLNGTVIVCLYEEKDAKKRLVKSSAADINLDPYEASGATVDIAYDGTETEIKVFLLDQITFEPLCEVLQPTID